MDNKKERIIHAAIDVFCEKGIEKTKVSDIVKKAGIAQGTFYIYFSSKLSVMPSIAQVMVDKMITEINKKVNKTDSFLDQLKSVIEAVFSITKDYREIHAMVYAGLATAEFLQEWETLYSPYYAWMSEFLSHAKDAGILRNTIDPDQTAVLLIGLIETVAEQTFLYSHGDRDMADIKKKEVLEFALHGLGVII
ncbi:TetR family transcriptional regulator [Neobacillus niacini]|uniref:TetR family transcriptional regulator n=1 Tax=Neobacillus niacini TaxID=86668 RepID=UPI002855877E|nr:TetR family transcriptional regulator [Neobacillus niacini]MDR6999075.1 AcrR family transcriptional regulator [Neobacillus niacini]